MSLVKNIGKLADKTVVITGASRGIGLAIAKKLPEIGKTTMQLATVPGNKSVGRDSPVIWHSLIMIMTYY